MKRKLTPIVLILGCLAGYAQLVQHRVLPVDTDPTIDGNPVEHHAWLDPQANPLGKLLLFLPGTNATAEDYTEFLKTAAELGYHSIGLSYENLASINLEVCPQTSDPTCHGRARREIWFGEDAHDFISVNVPNSILHRTVQLLNYLNASFPDEGWGQYLEGGQDIRWSVVTLAGHSQGAGNATFGSKVFAVDRVIMISWVDWMQPGMNPLWITTPGLTAETAYLGFIHTSDASIYNGIPTTWTNLGMDPYGPITSVDDSAPPYGNTHSLISSAPIDLPPTQVNYHNATCVDGFTTLTPEGDLLYKPVWQYLLGGLAPERTDPKARRISPAGVSYIDPEILSEENVMAFQTGTGTIWLSDLNADSGTFLSEDGLDLEIDTGATPLLTSINGPEFGLDQNGWSLVYTKPNGPNPQAWNARIEGTQVITRPVTSGSQARLSILASKVPESPTTYIMYSRGPSLANGEIAFTGIGNPAGEVVVDSTDNGVRWIDGRHSFFYIRQTGPNAGQVFLYDTETRMQTQVTNDGDVKTYAYGWFAPEYGELIFLVLLNDTQIGIYRDLGGAYWDRVTTIDVPEASAYDFIGSPETFVASNRSYISFVTKVIPTGSSYVESEVWVVDIHSDPAQRFTLRCDSGVPGRRTDPETYLGSDEVFVMYNQISSSGHFEIWSYATGIPVDSAAPPADNPPAEGELFLYPNPAGEWISLGPSSEDFQAVEVFTLSGQRIKKMGSARSVYVGDLPSGVYVLKYITSGISREFKLVRE